MGGRRRVDSRCGGEIGCRVISMDVFIFFFQAEDGIRDLVRSRGLGDVYKRQADTRNDSQTASVPRTDHCASTRGVRSQGGAAVECLSLIHI